MSRVSTDIAPLFVDRNLWRNIKKLTVNGNTVQ